MAVLFHFTKPQSREPGKRGVSPLASFRATHPGGSPRLPQRWPAPQPGALHESGTNDTIASARMTALEGEMFMIKQARGKSHVGNPALWAPGTTAVVHLGQHTGYATTAFNLHHMSLQTNTPAGPCGFLRMPQISSLLGSLPPWLSRESLYGGEVR